MEWKLSEAKNKLSEVFNKTLLEGPQKITRRHQSIILIGEKAYQELIGQKNIERISRGSTKSGRCEYPT